MKFPARLFKARLWQQATRRIPMMSRGISWAASKRVLKLAFSALPVPVINSLRASERGICLRKLWIDRQSFARIFFSQWDHRLWSFGAVNCEYHVRVRNTRKRWSEAAVQSDGIAEVFNGLSEILSGPLIPEETPLQIKIVGLRIDRAAGGCRRGLALQSGFQTRDNRLCDLILQGKHVAQLPVVFSRP